MDRIRKVQGDEIILAETAKILEEIISLKSDKSDLVLVRELLGNGGGMESSVKSLLPKI